MSLSSSESEEPMQRQTQVRSSLGENDTLQGALSGLIPLGLLVVIVVITLAVTALIRQLLAGSGFFAQQQAAVITLIVGLVLSLIVYGLAIFFTLRRVASWQQTNMTARARAALRPAHAGARAARRRSTPPARSRRSRSGGSSLGATAAGRTRTRRRRE